MGEAEWIALVVAGRALRETICRRIERSLDEGSLGVTTVKYARSLARGFIDVSSASVAS
jgi:hypothetical protein